MDVIGSDGFSGMLAKALDARHIKLEKRVFPDGEVCPRLMERTGSDVILAERMSLPLHPNRYMAEVLLTLKSLKMSKTGTVSLVMPYFIYSRQDRSFRPGEPFSAKHVLELLADSGASRFFTVSSHMERFKPMLTAPAQMPSHNIDGYSILGGHIKGLGLNQPVVIGPDMGVNMAARRVAAILGTESVSMEKKRDPGTGSISAKAICADFRGRDVVIVDDIISSGSTMLNAIKNAEKCGCERAVAAAVHAVQQAGLDMLKKYAWKVIATDTIDTPVSEISVIESLANAIRSAGAPEAQPSPTGMDAGGNADDMPGAIPSAFSWFK